jgi:5-methylcytosine-specific restriction endonuclease McrA
VFKEDGSKSRRIWHKNCVYWYKLLTDPAILREMVFERDQGKCCDCHKTTSDWEADHKTPLADVKDAPAPFYWSLDNLVTRCKECHKAKTITENSERATVKRNKEPF